MNRHDLSLGIKVGLALCIGMIFHSIGSAQCTNNLATKTYDTTLNNNGFAAYTLNFPQWNPDSGLLVSVKLSTSVSSQYGFNLRNVDAQPATYMLNIGQEDQISGAYGIPYTNLTTQSVGSYTLQPGQSQITPPFTFLNNHVSSDSITDNVTPFLGAGQVNINYLSFTYTNLVAYNNASYYYSNTVNNTEVFSVQYLYCRSVGLLAENITRWTATLSGPLTVLLDWSATNEPAGRQYDLQRSSDGHNFTTIDTRQATAGGEPSDYSYTDHLPDGSSGNWYYRIQLRDEGKFSWTPVRVIDISATEKSLRVYPNPATDYINLSTGTAAGDWQVDILSANGSLVQRETYLQSNLLHLLFRNRLSAGAYFARLTGLHGQKPQVASFIVKNQ
jgi:hypothetical protein